MFFSVSFPYTNDAINGQPLRVEGTSSGYKQISYTIKDFKEQFDALGLEGGSYIILEEYNGDNNTTKELAIPIVDFLKYYSSMKYEKSEKKSFEKSKNESDIISKIKAALSEHKDVICSFKNYFTIEKGDGGYERISPSFRYSIEDIKEKGNSENKMGMDYIVLSEVDKQENKINMNVDDFCKNYKKVKYVRLVENVEQPDVIKNIDSALKKGKTVMCKFNHGFSSKDFKTGIPMTFRSRGYIGGFYEINGIDTNQGYVSIYIDHATNFFMSITDFYNNYSKIKYETVNKRPIDTTISVDTTELPEISDKKIKTIISKVESALKKNKAVSCGFVKKFDITDVKSKEKISVYGNHAYAVVGIDKYHGYIRLIDPNKSWGRTKAAVINSERPEPLKEGGHLAMSFKDFAENFANITYSKT